MTELSYRLLEQREWSQVQGLMDITPMTARMPLIIRRPASSLEEAYPRLSGEDRVYGCFDGDKLVGCFRALMGEFQSGRGFVPMGYMSDVRIHPRYRGRGILQTFVQSAIDDGAKINLFRAFCFSNVGNDILSSAIKKVPALDTDCLARFKTTSYFLNGLSLTRDRGEFRRIETPALKQVPGLDTRQAFASYVDDKHWERFLSMFGEVEFYAHADRPDQVAFALWNTARVRRYTFSDYPLYLKGIRRAWNLTLANWRAAEVPAEGEAWPIVDVCFTDPEWKWNSRALSFCRQRAAQLGGLMMNVVTELNGETLLRERDFEERMQLSMSVETELKAFTRQGHEKALGTRPFVNLSLM